MKRTSARLLLALAAACCAANAFAAGPAAGRFSFALIGDAPYGEREEWLVALLLEQIDRESVAFVIHDGDLKSGDESCADEVLEARRALLDRSRRPLVYVPGDNEWTDCHRPSNGGFNPVERLEKLRELFFNDDKSLGEERIRLTRQSETARFRSYRENVRWEHGGILFVGMNVPGSNNNWRTEAGRNGEWEDRLQANRAWLARAFEIARQRKMPGIVIAMQADPDFENKVRGRRDGYSEFKSQLASLAAGFTGRVLIVHGDGHIFRHDQPLRGTDGKPLANVERVETFGTPFVLNWVQVNVDPASPKVFSVRKRRAEVQRDP